MPHLSVAFDKFQPTMERETTRCSPPRKEGKIKRKKRHELGKVGIVSQGRIDPKKKKSGRVP